MTVRTQYKHNTKRNFLTPWILLLFLCFMSACVEDDGPWGDSETRLVVEGWIESDGYPVVILTSSINPISGSDIHDIVVSMGKVTISDGEQSVVMTGSGDSRYFPPYIYRTSNMKGVPGRTYTIVAEYRGKKVTAVSKMPEPIEITDCTISPIESNDTLRAVEISAVSPGKDHYCRVFTRVLGKEHRYLPSMLSAIELPEAGQKVNLPVFKGKTIVDSLHFVPQLRIGDTVDIKLATIERSVYQFWTDYDNAVNFGGTVFISSPNTMHSNIEGGYGIWSAQGVSTRRIVIE